MIIDGNSIIEYANIAFMAIILLCGLVGFFRGTLKSIYFMFATLAILIFSWIFMGTMSKSIATLDVSKYGIVISGISVQSPIQFVQVIVERQYPQFNYIFTEGSQSLDLIQGVIGMGIKIIYFVILIIAMFTVYHLVAGIIWLILRKPLRRLFVKEYKISLKFRKNFKSRLGGFTVGLTKGLIYVLLVCIIWAGVASISKSAVSIVGDTEVALVCVNDTMTVVQLSATEKEIENQGPLSEYQDLIDIATGYYETVPGKVFDTVKIGKDQTKIDELLFDSIFSIQTNNGTLELRKEIQKITKILSSDAVTQVMAEGFDISKLYLLSNEDLKELVDLLSSLEIIKIIVPVGIEFIAYSDALTNELGEDFATIQQLIQSKYKELVELNYCEEVKNLGYIFVDVVELLGEGLSDPTQIDFFGFNQKTLNEIFNSIGQLELLEIVAPVTINFILNSEVVKSAIENTGFTMEDLGLSSDIDFVAELMNLPKIYEKLLAVGLKTVDGVLDISSIDPTKIEGLVEALFDSIIVQNAVPVIATTLINTYMPEELSGIFTKEEVENVNWEEEFTPVLSAAAMLLKTGILTSENKLETITNLEDKTIDDLAKYLSGSKLFCNNLDEVIGEIFVLVLEGETEFVGLDSTKGEVWDQNEIASLFKVMKKLANGLSLEMTDEQAEELAISLTSSKFIKKNLNNLVKSITSSFGIQFEGLKEDEWTTNEIFSTFKAINILSDIGGSGGVSIDQILNLDNEKLNVILESKVIKDILVKLLVEKTVPGQELELLKGVYENGIDEYGNKIYSWNDEFISVNSTVSNGILTIASKDNVIQYNIYKNGRYFLSTTNELVVSLTNETYTYDSNDEFTVKGIVKKGEIRNIFNSISKLNLSSISNFDIDLKPIITNKKEIFASYIFTKTVVDQLLAKDKVYSGGVLTIPDQLKDINDNLWYGDNGELMNILNALDCLLGISESTDPMYINNLNDSLSTFSINNIIDNCDVILKSKVLSSTIVDEIRNLNYNGLCIPSEYIVDNDLWLSEYDNSGSLIKHHELGNLIKSLDLILTDDVNDLKNIDIYKMFDSITKVFENDQKVEQLLSSTIICETLKDNIINTAVLNEYYTTSFANYNKDVNNTSEWYSFNINGTPEKKELWNLMEGLMIILDGSSLDDLKEFNINMIINNEKLIPSFDSNYNSINSNVSKVLNSIILEEAFASIVKEMCSDQGYLSIVINVPEDVNWYRKDVNGKEEYDLQTFLESFFLIQEAVDFANISDITQSGSSLRKLTEKQRIDLATGMVTSRIFKGSIADMFNAIFTVDFALKVQDPSLSNEQKLELANWWLSNKFDQSEFDTLSKTQAKEAFINKLNTICEKLNK